METINVKLTPTKELFLDSTNGYRVISCRPYDFKTPIELNKYNNFTISGSNITNIKLNEPIELKLRKDENAKYPANYKMLGYVGVDITEKEKQIKVDPEKEMSLLSQFMEYSQAENVHKAYPNFIQMVLDGKEGELDYNNIYNVGAVRFEQYVEKIHLHFHSILFCNVAFEWGIDDFEQIEKISKNYGSPEDFEKGLKDNPYHIFFDLLHFSFEKSDKIVLKKNPDLIDSLVRCEYACLEILQENELEGNTRIDAELLEAMAEELVPEAKNHLEEAVTNSDLIYYDEETGYSSYKSTYENELTIKENILKRANEPINLNMEWQNYTTVDGFKCTEEQEEALKLINENKIVMIRGYAGCGKTTVMKSVILMLEDYCKDYLLLAPTGKASARLRETTGRDAMTIHMFLARNKEGLYSPDFVIIDEMSMVGVDLLALLLDTLPETTRIVFICDEAQLASISCGNVVQDIIDSGKVPTANLTKVFRYGSSGLATIATDTRNGDLSIRTESDNNYDDYHFETISSDPIGQVLKLYEDLIKQGYTKDEIMVLCPFNKSSLGTYAINEAIQSHFNTHSNTKAEYKINTGTTIKFKVGDKVINTHNNYHMPVLDEDENGNLIYNKSEAPIMNGDIGYVRKVIDDDGDGKVAMIVDFDGTMALIKGSDLTKLLLGYCITIHKSQGSQAKIVIVITGPIHKRMLTRNILYVADSRAEETLYEIGDIGAIENGLEKQENRERDTWLKDMLENG